MEIVGYKLIKSDTQDVIESWGGIQGQCPGIPNPLILPTRLIQIHCPEINVEYADYDDVKYKLITIEMEPLPPKLPDLLPYQFYAMLELSGMRASLDQFIQDLGSPANIVAKAKLEHTLIFQRNNDLVLSAQAGLGLSDAQLDALWIQAAAL